MTLEQIEIARKLVKKARWQWMPGMLVMSDPLCVPRVFGSAVVLSTLRARVMSAVAGRWHGVGEYCVDFPDAEHENMSGEDLPGTLPDLTDPATLGCILVLARSAWADSALYAKPPNRECSRWRVFVGQDCAALGDTEADALTAALLEAP